MRPAVEVAMPELTEHFESLRSCPYDDVKGIPTFAAGIVLTLGMMLCLSWTKLDGSPATHDDIVAAWNFLTSPAGRATDQQGGAHYAGLIAIRATREAMLSSFAAKLAHFEGQLRGLLENWDEAPANAQLAALSHAWAFGGLFPATWPSWRRCFIAGDWAGCAAQDMPSAHEWAVQNDSFHRRIKLEQALLTSAGDGDPDQLFGWPLAA